MRSRASAALSKNAPLTSKATSKQPRSFRHETEEAIAAYEQALAEAKQKAHAIVDEGRAKLKAETDAERAKLEKELAKKGAEAEARIEKAKNAAMKDVNSVAADVAADLVKELTGTTVPKAEIDKAVTTARKA